MSSAVWFSISDGKAESALLRESCKLPIDALIAPKKKLSLNVKIKRYLDAYIAREKITIITQAVAPRQDGISNNENES